MTMRIDGPRVMVRLALIALLSVAGALAGEYSGIKTSTKLYTTPDTSLGGGLRGRISGSVQEPVKVVAISPDEPQEKCYDATVSSGEFTIYGMQPGKYDLVVFFADRMIEGLTLARRGDDNTLTSEDRTKIDTTIERAVPFFDVKEIHRIEGITGREGKARGLTTYLRTGTTGVTMVSGNSLDTFAGQLRSVRLVHLEDVGPGWQIALTREIYRKEVLGSDPKGVLPSTFSEALSQVRVSDKIKDMGDIALK